MRVFLEITILRELWWVIKIKFTDNEKNHTFKVIIIAICSGSFFSELNFRINTFKNTVRDHELKIRHYCQLPGFTQVQVELFGHVDFGFAQ